MKKLFICLSVLFTLVLIQFCGAVAQAEAFSVDSSCKIVIGADCSATDRFAAETLASYIEKICGRSPEIVKDDTEKTEHEISVGETNRFSFTFDSAIDGSYVIKKTDSGIAIIGCGNRGTIYGVYGFLEKYCGLKKYTAELADLSCNSRIEIPEDIDYSYNSYFEYTDTDWLSPCDVEYSLANGLSGGVYRSIPEEQGGTVNYIGQFCHTLSTVYCPADKYFAEHPDYFALHNGKRVPNQLCLTNENTYNIVLSEVLSAIKENHNPNSALQILSITQADNEDYCECDACKSLDDENLSHAGTMITFVNKIAQAVKAAGYSNIAIDTFAYRYTRTAPSKVVPLENVIVRLCTIECCFSHSLDDESCSENISFMNDLTAWGNICNRLYIWDYTTNYARTLGIFPDFAVLQKNMQTFYNNGVRGVYEEGNYYIRACNTEFGELRAYLLSKLMQNPFCDYEAETDAFLEAYYGAGWKNIKSFIDITSENAAKQHLFIYDSMQDTLSLSDEQVTQCDTLWQNAINECTDETQNANINRSLLCWRFWKSCNQKNEFRGFFSRTLENKKLYNDFVAAGVTKYGEASGFPEANSLLYITNAENWGGIKGDTLPLHFLFYPIDWVMFIIIIAVLLAVFIMAIIQKKYVFLIPLPLTCAILEVVLWNRRAFLAWKNIGEFVLTLILLCAYFGAMFIFLLEATNYKPTKKSILKSFIIGAFTYIVPHEAFIIIINNVMNNGTAAETALSTALTFEVVIIAAVSLIIFIKLIKNRNKEITK